MKKVIKWLTLFLIAVLMLSCLAGCGASNNNNENGSNSENKVEINQKNSAEIENSSIKETAENYYTALYHTDSKTAYKYVDFVGVIAWIKKEASIQKNISTTFTAKYNELSNDSEQVKKIIEHFNNEEMYTRINKEVTNKDVNVEVTDEEDLGNNLYKARVKVLYPLNGTMTGSDKTLYFLKKDGGFYIINDSALWAKKDITDLIGMY